MNAALEQFVAKAHLAKKTEKYMIRQVIKRKEALESKLFKMKYKKLLKALSGSCSLQN